VKQTEMTKSKWKAQTETNFVMYETTNMQFKHVLLVLIGLQL